MHHITERNFLHTLEKKISIVFQTLITPRFRIPPVPIYKPARLLPEADQQTTNYKINICFSVCSRSAERKRRSWIVHEEEELQSHSSRSASTARTQHTR
jgi:hypothetical protein